MAWPSQRAEPVAEDPEAQGFYERNFEERQSLRRNFQDNQSLGANFPDNQNLGGNFGENQSLGTFQDNRSLGTFQDNQNLSGDFQNNQSLGRNFGDCQNLGGNFEDNQSGNPLSRTETTDWASFAARTGFAPVGPSDDMQSPQGLSSSALPSSKTNSASSDRKQSAFSGAPNTEAPNKSEQTDEMSRGLDSGNKYDNPHAQSPTLDTEQHDLHASAQPSVAHRARWELLRSLVRQHDNAEKDPHQPEQPVYSNNSSPPKVRQHQFQAGPLPARSSSTSMRPLMLPQMVEDRKALNSNVPGHGTPNMRPQEPSEKSPPLPPRTQIRSSEPLGPATNSRQNPFGFSSPPPIPLRPTTPAMQPIMSLAIGPNSIAPSKPLQRSNALATKSPSHTSNGTNPSPQSSHLSNQQAPHTPPPNAARIHPAVLGADSAHQAIQQSKVASAHTPLSYSPATSPNQQPQASRPAPQSQHGVSAHKPLTTHPATQTAQGTSHPPPREAQPKPSPSAAIHSAQLGEKPHGVTPSTPPAHGRQLNAAAATPPRQEVAPHPSTPSRSTGTPDHRQSATPPPHPAAGARPVAHGAFSVPHTPPNVPASHPSPNGQPHVAKTQAPPHTPSPVASKSGKPTPPSHPPAASRPQTPAKPAGLHVPATASHPVTASHPAVSPHPPAASRPPSISHPQTTAKPATSQPPAASHPAATPHPPAASHTCAISRPPAASHLPPASHPAAVSHLATAPHQPATSHSAVASHPQAPSHPGATLHPPAKPYPVPHPAVHPAAHPTVPHPPAPHPSAPLHPPAKPHPTTAPQKPTASHQTTTSHPQAPSKPATPRPIGNSSHPTPVTAKSSTPRSLPAAPHQESPVHATKTAPNSQQKQHSFPQPHAAHPSAARSALIPHTAKSTPTKPAHPKTQTQSSSHANPTTHPAPAGKLPTPKATSASHSKPVSHAPSHHTTATQPSHSQHHPEQPGIKQSARGTPNHPDTTTHANHISPKPITRKPSSLNKASAVARRGTPQVASSNTASHTNRASSQRSAPAHGSKQPNQTQPSKQYSSQDTPENRLSRKPDFNLSDSLPAILGQLAGGDGPDGEVDLEQEADNIVHLFLYGTALVVKSFVSEIAEEDGWGQIDYFGEGYEGEGKGEGGRAETLSEAGMSSRSELSGLDHESEGNELD